MPSPTNNLAGASILVVDDEPQMLDILDYALVTEGARVSRARNAREAWGAVESTAVDLVVLDVMLPDASGIALCSRMQQLSVPVILLTALGTTDHRLEGLEAGADDYLVKPFSPRELLLRINAVLRRTRNAVASREEVLECGRVRLVGNRCFIDGEAVALSEIEFRLLWALLSKCGEPVDVRSLLNTVWHTTATQGGRNMVKTTVYRLRRRLAAAGIPEDAIQAVRGRGYVAAAAALA